MTQKESYAIISLDNYPGPNANHAETTGKNPTLAFNWTWNSNPLLGKGPLKASYNNYLSQKQGNRPSKRQRMHRS